MPALVMIGDPDGVRAILEQALRPGRAYLNCKEEHLGAAVSYYAWDAPIPMWRMVLEAERWEERDDGCVLLTRQDAQWLRELYALGPGNAYDSSQIGRGVFYGRLVDGELVSVAGTHLVSPTYGVAAVGNVFTHPAHRGRGHATAATRAVIGELLRRQVATVVLNVRQDNRAALSMYEKLGFRCHSPYLEGPAVAL